MRTCYADGIREFGSDPISGQGQMKPERLEIESLRSEVNKCDNRSCLCSFEGRPSFVQHKRPATRI